MRLPRHLLTALFILSTVLSWCRSADGDTSHGGDLAQRYGLDASMGKALLSDVLPNEKDAQERFPNWSKRWIDEGGSLSGLMGLSYIVCAWNEVVLTQTSGPVAMRTLQVPRGRYLVNATLLLRSGFTFSGRGSDPNGTVLLADGSTWVGKHAMLEQVPIAFLEPFNAAPLFIQDLALEAGDKGPRSGIALGAATGELHLQRLALHGWNVGLRTDNNASLFLDQLYIARSSVAGVILNGGAHVQAAQLRSEDNAALLRVEQGSGSEVPIQFSARSVVITSTGPARANALLNAMAALHATFDTVHCEWAGTAPRYLCTTTVPRTTCIRVGTWYTNGAPPAVGVGHNILLAPGGSHIEGDGFSWCPDGGLPTEMDPTTGPAAGAEKGTAKAGASAPTITLGEPDGRVLPNMQWGFNTSSLFSTATGSDTGLHHRIQEMHPRVLRFPGGTLANFYHPGAVGYGLRAQDLVMVEGTDVYGNISRMYEREQQDILEGKVTANYLTDMVSLANATNVQLVYVANLLNGTVAETMACLDQFRQAGVQVVAVELGNESHLKAYESVFPNADAYLSIAAPFAAAIATEFPDIRIGLTAYPPGILKGLGPAGTQRAAEWNATLANASFGDALTLHCYARTESCTQTGIKKNFSCASSFNLSYLETNVTGALNELTALGNDRIWLTEWNVDGPYSHYGNSLLQALFYVEMSMTMANYPAVDLSTCHNLLSWDEGYNVVQKEVKDIIPQVNYYAGVLLQPAYAEGNKLQPLSIAASGVRGMAFRSDGNTRQHLYLSNRSGTSFSLTDIDVNATDVTVRTLGGDDLALGSGPNDARPTGDLRLVTTTLADLHDAVVPAFGVVHLSWLLPPPPANTPIWATTFAGTENCRLVATKGSDVVQAADWGCGSLSAGTLTTQASTHYPASFMVKRVNLVGVTFQSVAPWLWVNSRIRFSATPGQLWDPVTQQVLATVQVGVRYELLTLEFSQPVILSNVLGFGAGGWNTAPMTIEALRLFP
jgi:hypothetical protein